MFENFEQLERYCRLHQTSGTSGRPLRWLDTAESWSWMLDCWTAMFQRIGLRAGYNGPLKSGRLSGARCPLGAGRIEPAELHSILACGGLVGFFLAPSDYGVLPRVLGTFAKSMEAPEYGARAVEPFLCFLAFRAATRSAYAASVW